jgi:hypothetical protein
VPGSLAPGFAQALADSFPRHGFSADERATGDKPYRFRSRPIFPLVAADDQPALPEPWRRLVHGLIDQRYRHALSKLTSVDLDDAAQELTLWRYDPGCWLAPHRDKPGKLVSHVIYFNRGWDESWGGALRLLRSPQIDDVAAEVAPRLGTSAVLVRSEDSWHAVAPVRASAPAVSRLSLTSIFYADDVPRRA